MKILVIENYDVTPLGLVGEALADVDAEVCLVRAQQGEPVPGAADGYAGLVVLGGGQNALADDTHPYFPALCDLIREFHQGDRPVLGLCLGAQLIARAFDGENLLDRPVELGWHQVRPTDAGRADPIFAEVGDGAPLFQWHSDTFALPKDAVHLAASDMTPNQAFRVGRATYGLQAHIEADTDVVRMWTEVLAGDLEKTAPDWPDRLEGEVRRHAEDADRAGAAMARAWTALL